MEKFMSAFLTSEDGAVTVDWVVLTAFAGFMGVLVVSQLMNSSSNIASNISDEIATMKVTEE
ncbi:hypothetical protein ACFE33_03745 [Falsihalocynthiibacter sp. SS001]|uniref:hypothetical protein n=1 Tax=Falsihalocynthiibacter sp. SS001 TaxID=3349698 RepID=UPI0036D35019